MRGGAYAIVNMHINAHARISHVSKLKHTQRHAFITRKRIPNAFASYKCVSLCVCVCFSMCGGGQSPEPQLAQAN